MPKLLLTLVTTKRTRSHMNINKNDVELIIDLLSGNYNVRPLTSPGNQDVSDYCRPCEDGEEFETIKHLLCPNPSISRRKHHILLESTISCQKAVALLDQWLVL